MFVLQGKIIPICLILGSVCWGSIFLDWIVLAGWDDILLKIITIEDVFYVGFSCCASCAD